MPPESPVPGWISGDVCRLRTATRCCESSDGRGRALTLGVTGEGSSSFHRTVTRCGGGSEGPPSAGEVRAFTLLRACLACRRPARAPLRAGDGRADGVRGGLRLADRAPPD